MATYRVGVSLSLRAGGYTTSLTGASAQTRRFGGVVDRTAGRATRAFRNVAVAGDTLGGALRRTAGVARAVGTAARRMADTMGSAIGRTQRRVNGLIGRFRELRRAGHATGSGVTGGIGRLAAAAGGVYGVTRVVTGEAELSRTYTDLAVKAKLDADQQADMQRRVEQAAEVARIPRRKLLESVYKELRALRRPAAGAGGSRADRPHAGHRSQYGRRRPRGRARAVCELRPGHRG